MLRKEVSLTFKNRQERLAPASSKHQIVSLNHSIMIAQDKIAVPFNFLNKIGSLINKVGINYPTLTAEAVLEQAAKISGLSDFGEEHYLEGLEALMYSARKDNINFLGRFLIYSLAVNCAQSRLQWVEQQKITPTAFQSDLTPPLIVVGIPRSGTTIMHRMLNADLANQAIPMWRLVKPFPPTKGKDRRLAQLSQDMKIMDKLRPQMAFKHELSPEKPEECIMVQGLSFNSLLFYASAPVYSYLDWYQSAGRFKMYEEYASMLHWYQSQDARRLVMKSPPHAADLTELLAAVPNALIVQTHRDPVPVVNSANSLFHTLHSFQLSPYDPQKMVAANLNQLEDIYQKNAQKRATLNHNICDVDYKELVKDPIGTTKKVYAHFGLEWTEAYEHALGQFMRKNPKDKLGKHSYSAEDFGLTNEGIQERFGQYVPSIMG